MAATNMLLAGLEIGCKVLHNNEPFTVGAGPVENYPLGICVELRGSGRPFMAQINKVVRDYDDAQNARQTRFEQILDCYPGDAGVPEETDTIERYVLVQCNDGGDGMHAFVWGDTFADCVECAGGEVLDGWMPEAVFDLDTGVRIEVHVSSPILTVSEDQNAGHNILDGPFEETAYHYDHIADAITVNVTCSPEDTESLSKAILAQIQGTFGIHDGVTLHVEQVRQRIGTEA